MSDLVQNTDHVGTALAKLLHQFKNSTQLNEFFSAVLAPLQTVETDAFALYAQRWPGTAVGVQLDNLGAIVGQAREGRNDTIYRLWIQARILVNRSKGRPDDSLQLMALVSNGSDYSLTEGLDAEYQVNAYDLNVSAEAVFDLLRLVKPAGVRLDFVYSDETQDNVFTYDTGPGYDVGVYAGSFTA